MNTTNKKLTRLNSQSIMDTILHSPSRLMIAVIISQLTFSLFLLSASFSEEDLHGSHSLLSPTSTLALKGLEVYLQEGCQYCHTQNVRPFAWELSRFMDPEKMQFAAMPTAAEYSYETPFPKGSRRIGPDLSTIASLYTEGSLGAKLRGLKSSKDWKRTRHHYGYLFEEESTNDRRIAWKLHFLLQARKEVSDPLIRSSYRDNASLTKGELLLAYLLSRGKQRLEFNAEYYKK